MQRLGRVLAAGYVLTLAACAEIWSDEPLSQPDGTHYDARLLGNWYLSVPETEAHFYLRVAGAGQDWLSIFGLISQKDAESNASGWLTAVAFPTIIAGDTYYSIQILTAGGSQGRLLLTDKPGYFIASAIVDSDDLLRITFLDVAKLLALEKSGTLRLRRGGSRDFVSSLFIETPGADLASLIRRLGPDALFTDTAPVFGGDAVAFRRLTATPAAAPE